MVLHVAGALHGARVLGAFEFAEDLGIGLAGDVGEHVQAAAVGHANADFFHAFVSGTGNDGVQQRNQGLAAFQREALLADELRLQEGFECLCGVELAQDAQLLFAGGLAVRSLKAVLEPGTFFRILDVHVLDARGTAVGITQHAEDLAQLEHRLAAESAGGPLAVQVPQGQAVVQDVQVRVAALDVLQRVGVRHQVAAHAVSVDQLLDAGNLVDLLIRVDLDVRAPANRLVRDAQGLEDVIVEVLLAQQELVDDAQELAAAGALDDTVVIGGGQGDDLGDRVAGEDLLVCALELGRVLKGAGTDDAGLALGQARYGVNRSDAARVRQRDGGALVVVGGELAGAGALDQVFVGVPELGEVQGFSLLDVRAPPAGGIRPASACRWPGQS